MTLSPMKFISMITRELSIFPHHCTCLHCRHFAVAIFRGTFVFDSRFAIVNSQSMNERLSTDYYQITVSSLKVLALPVSLTVHRYPLQHLHSCRDESAGLGRGGVPLAASQPSHWSRQRANKLVSQIARVTSQSSSILGDKTVH